MLRIPSKNQVVHQQYAYSFKWTIIHRRIHEANIPHHSRIFYLEKLPASSWMYFLLLSSLQRPTWGCSSGFSSDLKNDRKLEDFDVSKIIFNSATFWQKLYQIQSQKTETNLNSITTTCVPRLWNGICKAICPCKKTRPVRRAITVPKFKGIKTALINEGMSHSYVWEPCVSWQKAYILHGWEPTTWKWRPIFKIPNAQNDNKPLEVRPRSQKVKKATGEKRLPRRSSQKNGTDMSKNTLSFSDLKISWMDNAFNFVRGSKSDGCNMTKVHVGQKNSFILPTLQLYHLWSSDVL